MSDCMSTTAVRMTHLLYTIDLRLSNRTDFQLRTVTVLKNSIYDAELNVKGVSTHHVPR